MTATILPIDHDLRPSPEKVAMLEEHRREFRAAVAAVIARNDARRIRQDLHPRQSQEDIDHQRDWDQEKEFGWAAED